MEPEVQGRGSQDWEEVGTLEPIESIGTGSIGTELGLGRLGSIGIAIE